MTKYKILNMSYGKNGVRYSVVKEFQEGTREHTLYVVCELPFFGNDNEMKLRGDMLGQIAFKTRVEALEEFDRRINQEVQLVTPVEKKRKFPRLRERKHHGMNVKLVPTNYGYFDGTHIDTYEVYINEELYSTLEYNLKEEKESKFIGITAPYIESTHKSIQEISLVIADDNRGEQDVK